MSVPSTAFHEFERILVIDPVECIDPQKWEPFVKINYAYGDGAEINRLVDEYATEHDVHNPPLAAR